MNLRAFGLEANQAFGEVAFAPADLGAVDLGDDGAVVLAGCLGRVPFADGLGHFVLELLIVLRFDLFALEEIEKSVVGVGALHFDALGPNFVGRMDVHQEAAVVAALLALLRLDLIPFVANDVILVRLLGVEVAVGMARADDLAVFDRPGLIGIFILRKKRLPAGKVLTVKEGLKTIFVLVGRSGHLI